jgi:hypothetical protein
MQRLWHSVYMSHSFTFRPKGELCIRTQQAGIHFVLTLQCRILVLYSSFFNGFSTAMLVINPMLEENM